MSLSGFPEVKWIYIKSFGIVDSPEYKELVVPTPLLIQPDRQGFSYANPADRNRSPNAELSNHNFEFYGVSTVDWKPAFGYNDCVKAARRNIMIFRPMA